MVTSSAVALPQGIAGSDAPIDSQSIAAMLGVAQVDLQQIEMLQQLEHGPRQIPVRFGASNPASLLQLQYYDPRSSDFELTVIDDNGPRSAQPSASKLWSGRVLFQKDSLARVSIDGSNMDGTVRLGDTVWGIESLASVLRNTVLPPGVTIDAMRGWHAVYDASETLPSDATCTVAGLPEPDARADGGGGGTSLVECEIAIEADFRYFQRFGSVAGTENDVMLVVAGLDVIYERDVDVTFELTRIVVRTTSAADPYTTNDASNLLGQFRTRWNNNFGGTRRDIAHLFTGRNLNGSTIGIASLGVVCSNFGYGVSENGTRNQTSRTGLVGHEIGHNFNARHCNGQGNCRIMCASLGGCAGNLTRFGPDSITSITRHRDSRNCLSPASPPVLQSLTPFSYQPFGGDTVTVTGVDIDTITSVLVGGSPVTFRILDDTSFTFQTERTTSFNFLSVQAESVRGLSNSLVLFPADNIPPRIAMPAAVLGNSTLQIDVGGVRNHIYIVTMNINPAATVPLFGFDVMFPFFVIGVGGFSLEAGLGQLVLPTPGGALIGPLDFQVLDFDAALNLAGASEFATTFILP